MKKLLNTLYILTPDSYIYHQNEAICIKIGGTEKTRIPSHTIESILCFGNTTVSTPFIEFCGTHGITMVFLSPYGKFYGRIYGPVSGNVLLRKKQFEALNNSTFTSNIVKNILLTKLANCRTFLLRSSRDQSADTKRINLTSAAEKISDSAKLIKDANDLEYMRGIEGKAASDYFSVFDEMLKVPKEELLFDKRSRRPPENEVNALLSFLYMLLKNSVQSALECVGLDPAVGFLHALRPGRPALALDLMEELRAPLCDRMAISLINLRQIKVNDFENLNGRYILSDKARRIVIDEWQKRKREEIFHPFIDEKIEIGLIPFVSSLLLARVIRGDLDEYPAFLWR